MMAMKEKWSALTGVDRLCNLLLLVTQQKQLEAVSHVSVCYWLKKTMLRARQYHIDMLGIARVAQMSVVVYDIATRR